MVQFLAFSLQDQVEKYGAYIGIAAFFGLAVLTILYFSQARELRRLRDWAGRAPERAAEVEARVVAQAEAARRVQAEPMRQPAGMGAATAAAAAAAAGGGAAATAGGGEQATQVVEPGQSGNGTAAGAEAAEAAKSDAEETPDATPEGAAADAPADDTPAAEMPAGDSSPTTAEAESPPADTPEGAPAEALEADSPPAAVAAGTQSVADEPAAESPPADAPAPGSEDPSAVPATDERGNAERSEEPEPVGSAGTASGNGAPVGEIPVAPVPRATPLPRRAPAPAAPLRQPSRSATVPPRRSAPPRRGASAKASSSWSHSSRAPLIGVGLGVLVVAVVALFATGVIGGGSDDNPPAANTSSSSSPSTTGSSAQSPSTLTPASTKVAVLNGTTIPGLASTEKDKLSDAGFTGPVTTGNNTDQQRADSSVLYGSRSGARTQARTVAQKLDIADVRRLDADTRDLGENADVVVILGQDKAP